MMDFVVLHRNLDKRQQIDLQCGYQKRAVQVKKSVQTLHVKYMIYMLFLHKEMSVGKSPRKLRILKNRASVLTMVFDKRHH